MARFDGGRQGLGVWLISVLVTILVAVVGVVFGSQYDVYQWVNMPAIPVPTQTLALSGVITLVVLLVITALAAFLGGKAGQRFHSKVDRAAGLATR